MSIRYFVKFHERKPFYFIVRSSIDYSCKKNYYQQKIFHSFYDKQHLIQFFVFEISSQFKFFKIYKLGEILLFRFVHTVLYNF